MNIHYVYHFGYVRWISHRLVVKPRGACKGNSRGGHARLVGCARKAEKGNDAYVSIHELTKNGKTYLVGNRLLSSLLARARISRAGRGNEQAGKRQADRLTSSMIDRTLVSAGGCLLSIS